MNLARPDRIKLCFIAETVHAGVGRHIVDAACNLSERGHEVHLLYSPLRLEPKFLSTIQVASSTRCVPIRMPRAISIGDIAVIYRILKYIRIHGPFDIIHGHSSKGGGYARLLRVLGAKEATIYTPHAFITLSPKSRGLKRLAYSCIEAVLAHMTDRIVCLSEYERQHARALGIAESRLTTICNGIAAIQGLSRTTVRATLGLTDRQVVVGFVGRMDDQKAPERLVAAARALLPELDDVVFMMIGDGPKRATLEAEIRDAGFSHRVHWLGAVDARDYMAGMDIFAMPSLYEGFPYVLLEALETGLPIVCTPVGGTAEMVVPNRNGFIVPHESIEGLAGAIRRLTTDDDLRRSMAAASRARVALFSTAGMVDALESLYRDVLDRGASSQRQAPRQTADLPSSAS